jgi:hypothetical protein
VVALGGAELGGRCHRGEGLAVFPWLDEEIQFFAEPAVGPEEAQAHGHGGNAETIGDFLGGVLQDVAQQADLAQIRSKLLDGIGEMLAHFAVGKAFFGIVFRRGHVATERPFAGAVGFFERDEFAVAALADHINGGVGGDARNPGVQIVARFVLASGELLEARNGFQKRFLADVFGLGRIAGQPKSAEVERGPVGEDQLGERFAVALASLEQKPRASGAIETDGCAAHDAEKNRSRSTTGPSGAKHRK